jgi:hypothetical protein
MGIRELTSPYVYPSLRLVTRWQLIKCYGKNRDRHTSRYTQSSTSSPTSVENASVEMFLENSLDRAHTACLGEQVSQYGVEHE